MNRGTGKNRRNYKGRSNPAFFKLHTFVYLLSGILLIAGLSNAYMIYSEGNRGKANEQQSLEEVDQILSTGNQTGQSGSSEPPNTYEEYSLTDNGEMSYEYRQLHRESDLPAPRESTSTETAPNEPAQDESASREAEPTAGSNAGYTPIAKLEAETIGLNTSVLSRWSYELLEISVNKFHGPEPNEWGNFMVVGHRYRNSSHFGTLHLLEKGDVLKLTDLSGRSVQYEVYEMFIIKPDEVEKLRSDYPLALTLITCDDNNAYRLVVKSRAIGE